MTENTTTSPNTDTGAAASQSAVSDASIAAKMAAMREHTERNLLRQQAEQSATGQDETAESSSPVAPENEVPEVDDIFVNAYSIDI